MTMSHPAQTVHDTYDICTLALEVLTPLHVGGREGALKSLDFVFDAGTVHVVDEDRFAQWLQAQGIVDLFVEEAKTGTMDLKRFIQKRPGWRQALPTWTRYTIKGGRDGMQEFRPLIRDAHDRVYLPGSAVKGALRTAILWKRLHEGTPVPLEQVEAAVERGIVKDRASGGWRWLQVANPENPGQKKPVGKERFSRWLQEAVLGNDPHHDLLRCLTVRDAYP
ncbi:MAG: type III-A CRISPR-associated RAMP protein Csm5, partial [Nitrospirae bacterium]